MRSNSMEKRKNKFKKILCVIGIIFAMTLLNSCNQKKSNSLTVKEGILTIGTEFGYPPFEYLDKDGKTLIGFDVDMWNELCFRLKLKPEFFDTQWIGLFPALESGRYDCIISAVTITPERKKNYLITTPYVQNSQCIVLRQTAERVIDEPKKLAGLKVAYQSETVSDVYVTELNKKGLKIKTREYDKLLDAFDDLSFGRVDALVAESVAAKNIVKNNPEKFRIDFIGEPDAYFGILVNKQNQQLFDLIQKALDSMYEDGWMARNEEKWLK